MTLRRTVLRFAGQLEPDRNSRQPRARTGAGDRCRFQGQQAQDGSRERVQAGSPGVDPKIMIVFRAFQL
eukprot:CAMPEP_0174385654 /NCGR_PEP_ID=MMETSP0811_2-20130205/126741_1 /TAXON_ID=73025 ORGANISM="Eutreptiella gymnastica-like, Strain CCMP1594" /NCGR_SAMPLE_ID=MMETSP0811_2 /ASSEMBLY_ACC=CAM_ASM_000667 /LENGTH=68 /DNA_ID=CAMNT_0015540037 /DNA_START=669 /DNA_END=875 /DNA_ORIENTATION=+